MNNTGHTAIFWKQRIKEMINQYNSLSKEQLNYDDVEKSIGDSLERAVSEYVRIQIIYTKFISDNFIRNGKKYKKTT